MKRLILLLALIIGLTTFQQPVALAAPAFKDVDPKQYGWAMDAISFMVDKGVVSGYPDGSFQPGRWVDKAEMTVMIYRLFDRYRPFDPNGYFYVSDYYHITHFADVPKNHWAYQEISSIVTRNWRNVVFPSPEGYTFYPDSKLNRIGTVNVLPVLWLEALDETDDTSIFGITSTLRDIPVIITSDTDLSSIDDFLSDGRSYEDGKNQTNTLFPLLVLKKGDEHRFYDIYSGETAYKIALLQQKGVMTAWNGEFEPNEMLTRAEAVTILYRMYMSMKESGYVDLYSSK
ncbi:S-layer homology domain-containing protein [Brevibacillus brevis]|uniref:S-layer homology domain-containing protein n=1 Tax=Brevibacillus brevis TaxID=1393 RepID=UPI001EDAB744|nr:S-layer homology domain-containing protein [Brevibacillus brevis]UKL01030.1 S-layer homology domain-containing protein [Brevibacillus brevis]